MSSDTKQPLAWEILNSIKTKVRGDALRKIERLSSEHQERRFGSSERLWWASH